METLQSDSHSSVDEEKSSWKLLAALGLEGDTAGINKEYGRLGSTEVARAISRLGSDDVQRVLHLLDPEFASELVENMSDAQASEVVDQLEPKTAANIIEAMESSEAADLLGDLDADHAKEIIGAMEQEAAEDALLLTQYDDEVAGGLMVTEYLAYPETYTVGQVIADLRLNAAKYRGYKTQYAYVVTAEEHLSGVLVLRDLILADNSTLLRNAMRKATASILDTTDLGEVEDFFDACTYIAVPVTNEAGVFLGVVTREAVEEALGDRADTVYLKSQGIVGGEELRSMPWHRRSGRRLSWLSVNVLLNVLAASIIAFYEETLASVIALAVFLPIISDMSGCSGNQAVAVSIRELTLGLIRPIDYFYVWIQEIKVGIVNGLALGTLVAIMGWMWKSNPYLGLVVGGALAVNTVVAVSIGGLIPLVLKRFGMDPALASGPILTTVTDMCGFFIVLSFATLMLPHLI